jgi:hypothetical protein
MSAANDCGRGGKGGEWRATRSLRVRRLPTWGGRCLILHSRLV